MNGIKKTLILSALLGAMGLTGTAKADSLDNFTKKTLQDNNMFGRVLVLRNYQDGHFADTLGYAYFGNKILNSNPSVVYPSASLQKAMTAAMIT